MEQVIEGGNSYRGVATTMKILSRNYGAESPHYNSIRTEVISTYDVTHAMANLLKQELLSCESYQNFSADCHRCKQQLKQTELGFLAPPSQRSQCRYFNTERLANWAVDLLNCPLDIFQDLLEEIESDKLEQRLKEKFSWLNKYQDKIPLWATMVQMTRTLEKQLKMFGLNQESLTQFSKNISHLMIPNSLQTFYQRIINYLKTEVEKIQANRTILATSDVLESIFGKYKHFSQRCPMKDFRQTLLTIPLSTINLTSNVIKKALETVRCRDLSEWINEIFGQSMLSKRKAVFGRSFDDMKVV